MAYTSIVKLLKNVNLSMDYTDTLVFASVSAQTSYFLNKVIFTFNDVMYVKDNIIKIPDQAGIYLQCDYIMFQNPDVPNKWFYAFITGVRYLNDGTTIISYNEDFLQTWFFDMTINPCMVQREHVNDDTLGNNIKEEPVAIGPYVSQFTSLHYFVEWVTIMGVAVDLDNTDSPAEPQLYNKVLQALNWYVYQNNDSGLTALQSHLDSLASVGKSDAIVSMWTVPKELLPTSNNGQKINPDSLLVLPKQIEINKPTDLNGYLPKNNKLFTYPYTALEVSASNGQAFTLRWEFFNSSSAKLQYFGTCSPAGRIVFNPLNYEGISNNLDYCISLGNYPQCSWIQDVYSNWLATQEIRWDYQLEERAINYATSSIGQAASGLLNLATGNLEGGVESLGNMIGGSLKYEVGEVMAERAIGVEKEIHKIIPPSVKGTIGSDLTIIGSNNYGVRFYTRTITYQYAKSIDDYFSMYGYRVDSLKVPNIFGRESWNYVKTVNAYITGNAPTYAKENFKNLLNRGLTFWHGDYIGDYSRPNNIVEVTS